MLLSGCTRNLNNILLGGYTRSINIYTQKRIFTFKGEYNLVKIITHAKQGPGWSIEAPVVRFAYGIKYTLTVLKQVIS